MLARPRVPAPTFLAALLLAAVLMSSPASAAKATAKPRPATSAAPAAAATIDSDPGGVIARAEDERRWSDGALKRLLAAAAPATRARAALAVGRLQDSTTVRDLLPLLADGDATVREEAVFALGQIGSKTARPALEQLLPGAAPNLAALAIEALGKLGDRASTPLVANALGDPSPRIRAEAATALYRLADSTALDRLTAAAGDPDPEVRWRALWALERITAPDRIVLLAALHESDPEWLVRAYATRTIGRQKSSRGTAYLLQALDDPAIGVVVNALNGLVFAADSTNPTTLQYLARALVHPHPYVRSSAAAAMAERFCWVRADSLVARVALDSLASHLRDPDAATRGAAARALLARRGDSALARVTPLLADSSVYVRAAVLNGLRPPARVRDAMSLLRPALTPSAHLLERTTAIEVMAARHEPGAAGMMRDGLRDTSMLVVAACASGLADLGDSVSVPALAAAYAARAVAADADARVSIRDALRALAGARYADSLERAHPPRNAHGEYPPDFATAPAVKGAVLHTTAGDVTWAFYPEEAPQTVRNFVRLAERGYFDGTVIHRVVPNFVIQDGDPTGTGSGGPGYTIRCEYNRLRYDAGMVGMALSGKDTGGSQWFITHSPQPRLDGRYTIFARVTSGMDVVWRTVQGDKVLKVEIVK
jgi:cyclophilin family peptidyl-prolyl cis-trans isomerase/HEAT repeat protein